MAPKLKALTNEDDLKELKKKLNSKSQTKKTAKTATKVNKATTTKTLPDKLKTTTQKLADKRKNVSIAPWCKVILVISHRAGGGNSHPAPLGLVLCYRGT